MKYKKITIPLVILALIAGAILLSNWYRYAPREEGRCRLRRVSSPREKPVLAGRYYTTEQIQPEAVTDLPAALTSEIRFFEIPMPDGYLTGCIGEKRGKLVVYADTNRNGLLSDEKPYNAKTIKVGSRGNRRKYQRFGPITLKADKDTSPQMKPCYFVTDSIVHFTMRPTEEYTGKIRLGEQVYKLTVTDGDYDGKFTTVFSPEHVHVRGGFVLCDTIGIDFDGDGDYMPVISESIERMPLSKMLRIGEQYYSVDLSEEMQLTLTKTEPQFGTLQTSVPEVTALLWSDAFCGYVKIADGNCSLPAGRYHMHDFEGRLRTGDDTWKMTCWYGTGTLGDFRIDAGQTTRLDFGPPFTAKVKVTQHNRKVLLGVNFKGAGGEQYHLNIQKNDEVIEAPSFSIAAEDGTILHTGQFEYG